MVTTCTRRRVCAGMGAAVALAALPALAQRDKPIALVVPTAPGGSTDALARMVAEALGPRLGRTMVVENRPGANGTIGAAYVAKAPADGSVLLLNTSGQSINPVAMKNLPFDVARDFVGVAGLAQSPLILVASSQFDAQDAKALKFAATRSPERVAFAVGDMATRLATEQVMSALGIKATIANYKGTGPAMTDVAGGHVPLTVTTVGAAMPMIKAGHGKALALMAGSRLKQLPAVPTLGEQGFPVEFMGWWAISAPAGTPRAEIERVAAEVQKMMATPAFTSRLEGLFMTPLALGPGEFDAFFAADLKRMAALAAAAGIRPE